MRQKPANEKAVNNLINFINEMIAFAPGTPTEKIDVPYSIKTNQVAKRTFTDLKSLGYISVKGDEVKYKSKESPRVMALKILDHRLNLSKRTVHFPIPDFAGISQSLETIVERMAHLLSLSERSLKSAKTGQISEDADLFKVEDQRLYIAGQIASGIYDNSSACKHEMIAVKATPYKHDERMLGKCIHCGCSSSEVDTISYEQKNAYIVQATDDLMKRLLNQNSPTIKKIEDGNSA